MDTFKAARVVQFDIVAKWCSLPDVSKEDVLKLRKAALASTFESDEWKNISAKMKNIEESCKALEKN